MRGKLALISLMPIIFYLIALFFLGSYRLGRPNIVVVQNDAALVLINGLMGGELLSAIFKTLVYLWSNALVNMTIFLALISIGLLFEVGYSRIMDLRTLIISQIIGIFLIFALTNFSVLILFSAVGLLGGTLWSRRAFERKEKAFSTAFSFVSSRLKLMSVLLVIGLFFTLFANSEMYKKDVYETNVEIIGSLLPNATQVKEARANLVSQMTSSCKSIIADEYQKLSEDERVKYKSIYDSIILGVDEHQKSALEGIEEEEISIQGFEAVLEGFKFFDIIVKLTPLLTAVTVYVFFRVLILFVGVLSGIAYALTVKIKGS